MQKKMKPEQVRAMLCNYTRLEDYKDELFLELDRIRQDIGAKINASKSVSDTDGQPRGTRTSNPTASTVERIQTDRDYERHILQQIQVTARKMCETMRLLSYATDIREQLLRRFYLWREKLPVDYDKDTHLSRRRIQQILSEGLQEIADKFNERIQ